MKHPLEQAFDIDSGIDSDLPDLSSVIVPEDTSLDTTIFMALKAYQENAEIIKLIEPKNRIRYLEVGEKYLSLAKDAIHKRELLKLKEQEIDTLAGKDEPVTPVGSVNRNQLYDRLKKKSNE